MNRCAVCMRAFIKWSEYYEHIQIPHRIYKKVDPEIKSQEVKEAEKRLERFII